MKKLIVGIILGIVLTAATTATAAGLAGWRYMAPNVQCKGGKSVVCYVTDDASLYGGSYSVYISDCSAAVWYEKANGDLKTVYERWQPSCK